jgi:hypothetical protein
VPFEWYSKRIAIVKRDDAIRVNIQTAQNNKYFPLTIIAEFGVIYSSDGRLTLENAAANIPAGIATAAISTSAIKGAKTLPNAVTG